MNFKVRREGLSGVYKRMKFKSLKRTIIDNNRGNTIIRAAANFIWY